jgi:ABC-2 type transport system ATP-binding protein
VGAAEHRRRIDMLVALFELGPLVDTPVRQLSLGERMRCEIAASLLHMPQLLFLDEPTIGLDVSAKAAIR